MLKTIRKGRYVLHILPDEDKERLLQAARLYLALKSYEPIIRVKLSVHSQGRVKVTFRYKVKTGFYAHMSIKKNDNSKTTRNKTIHVHGNEFIIYGLVYKTLRGITKKVREAVRHEMEASQYSYEEARDTFVKMHSMMKKMNRKLTKNNKLSKKDIRLDSCGYEFPVIYLHEGRCTISKECIFYNQRKISLDSNHPEKSLKIFSEIIRFNKAMEKIDGQI